MPNDTYSASANGRAGSVGMQFDPSIGKWVSIITPPTVSAPSSPSSTGTTNSEVDSKGDADKEYIEQESNTLEGDLEVIPSDKTIRIKEGDTITLSGVGKVLSGQYYVSAVKRTITKDDGYSQSLTVTKNGFSDSLKKLPSIDSARSEVIK